MGIKNKLYDYGLAAFLLLLCLTVLIPFLYMLAVSFSYPADSEGGAFFLLPPRWTFDAYYYLFSTSVFVKVIGNTVYITVVGTILSLIVSVLLAYALSKKTLPGRRVMMTAIFLTMIFQVGLIPTYLVVKSFGLIDSYWAVMLPVLTNAFTIMIMKTFFQALPASLDEAARIDGAKELRILLSVVIPMSTPIIATFAIFFMVDRWNEFFNAIIYLKANKWPIQALLRQMVVVGSSQTGSDAGTEAISQNLGLNVKMAAILLAMLPIVSTYPFFQKYFEKGATLGAVKE
ncbi:carbohydrate ABC transporter permease [Paenibacillus psychroresistens]|uniref:Carbohydrate ABC transporter permease n=1 Tax=Paenibacillus psychroresistens TaxID=1778678 RepID=A0A6B8RRT5_9BACL|nr:carbohydrate ABC transporter permease [Paenibacillus psychroresistens]QGQ98432.1 carbohydrate ABC transporter permease [Paenibacillus psychroresistens]